jgi:hypothetical protein
MLYIYGGFSMQDEESKDFELQAKIPGIGELRLKLYQDTWTGLLKFIQHQWPWVMVMLLSGTIGAHVLGQAIPPSPKLPGSNMPTQR